MVVLIILILFWIGLIEKPSIWLMCVLDLVAVECYVGCGEGWRIGIRLCKIAW